ncbi:MAG: hypothetical protein AAGD92_09910 [Pseudomonadota bacterium]
MIEQSLIAKPLTVFVAGLFTLSVSAAGARLASQSRALIDNPNERSSHTGAVSRAGGVSILAGWLAGLFVLISFGGVDGRSTLLILAALGVLAAGVGFLDDRLNLSAPAKFAGQALVAVLFVFFVGGLETAPMPLAGLTELGAWGAAISMIWIIGFMNAFNFMDGVNGIAGGCAAVGLVFFAVIAALSGAPVSAAAAMMMAAAAFGFLPENLMRGRLFMGDGGSHLIAFAIAALSVLASNESGARVSALAGPVIFLPFIFDVAWTLTHRLIRRRNVLTAHREHLYQLILRMGASHASVAGVYVGMTAYCAAAAIFMLTAPPRWHWVSPGLIIVIFYGVALKIFREADRRGLLATGRQTVDGSAETL